MTTLKKRKMFVVSQPEYLAPFSNLFERTTELLHADAIMFTGGSDVSPFLYKELAVGSHTYCDQHRDMQEVRLFTRAKALGIPMLGICRGSQFLTVMAGGQLVQDVTGHGLRHGHEITTDQGNTVVISSTHHQMMHPERLDKDDYTLIAWANALSDHYLDGKDMPIPHSGIEPEIVWYPKIQALAIQGHPEIMEPDSDGVVYCNQLVKEYLLNV